MAHKLFDGIIALQGGKTDTLSWRTVYRCRKNAGRWQITGFTGYLPREVRDGNAPVQANAAGLPGQSQAIFKALAE